MNYNWNNPSLGIAIINSLQKSFSILREIQAW